jgi:cyanophycinase
MKIRLFVASFIITMMLSARVSAQQETEELLLPIGGGYSEIYDGFSAIGVSRAQNNIVKILVVPAAYSTNPEEITEDERAVNMQDAETRRVQIEEACKVAAPPETACSAILVPLFVRSDAEDPDNLAQVSDDLTTIFILGGDQTIAMQVIAGTPFEKALEQAYHNGVIVAGTSAGGGMQSVTMMGGYAAGFDISDSLSFGAPDVWNTPERRGLSFGIQDAILDQHFFQRGRLGRLLNAIALPDIAHVGVGIDAYTGVQVLNGESLENVFGLYTVAILDAETYHGANAVQYVGARNTLSLRNILVHLLAPGNFSYDLKTRQPSLADYTPTLQRSFDNLKSPMGSGPLFLSGGLSEPLESNPSLARFTNLSGGTKANIAVIASGYPSESLAQSSADKYINALTGAKAQTIVVPNASTQSISIPESVTGIILIGQDQSKIQPQLLLSVKEAWLSGIPVFADDAAAAMIGVYYSAHSPTPDDEKLAEAATQKSFLLGQTSFNPGLGMLEITLEPQLLDNNRWGRFFSLAYVHPQLITVGLNRKSVIEISPDEAIATGDNVTFILDLRSASLELGTNQGFVIANGLLDVFAPSEIIRASTADVSFSPLHAPTPNMPTLIPAIPTNTPTLYPTATSTQQPSPTITPKRQATRTLRPTNTPPVIPPAQDPIRSNWMVGVAILAVLVVIAGVWINWRKISKN